MSKDVHAVLETERMILRPWGTDDLASFHAIWGDPEVIWWGANESLEKSRESYASLLSRHADWPAGVGWYAMVGRDSRTIVGDVLLQPAKFVDGIEIGWHLRREAWGRGLATEGAEAVLAHGLSLAGLKRIYAAVAIQNDRSLRVVEKLGFRALRDMEYASLPHRLFAIDRPAG